VLVVVDGVVLEHRPMVARAVTIIGGEGVLVTHVRVRLVARRGCGRRRFFLLVIHRVPLIVRVLLLGVVRAIAARDVLGICGGDATATRGSRCGSNSENIPAYLR
jgi:hypothetical protein